MGGGGGERVRESFPEDIRPPRWLGGVGWRKKGTRLRRHWGGRFGAQRMHEVLPAAAWLGALRDSGAMESGLVFRPAF